MVNYNVIGDDTIQIYGNHGKVKVNGFANRVKVVGSLEKVWQYNISLFKDSQLIKIKCNEKDGTMRNIKALKDRVNRVIEKESV